MKKGTPHFLYTNKDSPDYVAPFAPFYSDRQKENLEIANILYEEKSNPSAGLYNHYTAEEAAEILRKLTPPGFES